MTNFLSKIRGASSFHYGEQFRPERDWFALLACGALVLAGSIAYNIWLFDHVATGGILGGSATSTAPVFNQTSLQAVESVFADRAAEEVKYRNGAYSFIDPSK